MGHDSGFLSFLHRRKPKQTASDSTHDEQTFVPSTPKEIASQDVVPSGKEYATEATKRTVEILTGVAGLVGIPLVKEVLDIGVSILSTCETINEVQGKVAELKNRIASYLLVIAKAARDPDTDPKMKSSQGLMDELKELKDCLANITSRLETIRKQNIVLTTLLPQANMGVIGECVVQFQDAVARFQTLRGIAAAQDLTRLQNQVEEVYQLARVAVEKMDRVQSSVDKLQAMLESSGPQNDAFTSSSKMPPIPDNFLGRDAVVNRVAEHLTSSDKKRSRLCILGPGGMGKTSAALAIMDHTAVTANFPSQNRLWIPCASLTSPSAFLAFLARRLGISGQTDPLQSVISTLEHSASPYVMLLDNFETPWHPVEGDQKFTKEILQALDAVLNLSILLTMRSHFPPLAQWQVERLDVLPLDDCRRIYTAIEPGAENAAREDLNLLLETIGRLPYAVTLVANQAKYSDASPAEILAEWRKVGSKMLSDVEDSSKGMDSSIELSVKSKYVASAPGAIELLQVLSMLPAGVYRDDLSIWIKSWSLSALSTLRNAALVVTRDIEVEGATKHHYLVLPVVQSYMRQPGRIPGDARQATYDACITFLRAHSSVVEDPNDPRFRADQAAIISQEGNIQTVITEILRTVQDRAAPTDETSSTTTTVHSPQITSELLDALLVFVSFQRYARPSLDLAKQLVLLAEREAPGTLLEARALYCLSSMQIRQGFRKAKELFLQLGELSNACNADWSIAVCSFEVDDLSSEERRQRVKETRSRWESHAHDPSIRATLLTQSSLHMWLSYAAEEPVPPEVFRDMTEAKDTYLSMNNRPWALAQCLVGLFKFLLQEKRAEEAHTIAQEVIELYKREGFPDRGYNHVCMAHCLKSLDNWGDELHATLQDGLKIARSYGSPYNLALVLDELVELYIVEKDWAAARLACEEIVKECRKGFGHSVEVVQERAEWNLKYLRESKEVGFEDGPSVEYKKPARF